MPGALPPGPVSIDVTNSSEERSSLALAYQWASRITGVSFEMVLPGVVGYWIDQKAGTRVLFTVLGFGFGLTAGMWHLIRMTRSDEGARESTDEEAQDR